MVVCWNCTTGQRVAPPPPPLIGRDIASWTCLLLRLTSDVKRRLCFAHYYEGKRHTVEAVHNRVKINNHAIKHMKT